MWDHILNSLRKLGGSGMGWGGVLGPRIQPALEADSPAHRSSPTSWGGRFSLSCSLV